MRKMTKMSSQISRAIRAAQALQVRAKDALAEIRACCRYPGRVKRRRVVVRETHVSAYVRKLHIRRVWLPVRKVKAKGTPVTGSGLLVRLGLKRMGFEDIAVCDTIRKCSAIPGKERQVLIAEVIDAANGKFGRKAMLSVRAGARNSNVVHAFRWSYLPSGDKKWNRVYMACHGELW